MATLEIALYLADVAHLVEHSFRKAGVVSSSLTIGIMTTKDKLAVLQNRLLELKRVAIAYSGGVDSVFLLKIAVDTLGATNVLACLGISESLGEHMYKKAIENAKEIGVDVTEFGIKELADPKYSSNDSNRCYHCKKHMFSNLAKIASENGFKHILCGNNYDDNDDYRPGSKAAIEIGVLSPIADAKLTKKEIREISRQLFLKSANEPASPCLASRISYGLEITKQRLSQIDKAESLMRKLGFVEFRVRHHNELARIEISQDDFEKIMSLKVREQIVSEFKKLGFVYISLDLQGFRSGALNESLQLS